MQLGERREGVVCEARAPKHIYGSHEAGQYSHNSDSLQILIPNNGRMAMQLRRLWLKG